MSYKVTINKKTYDLPPRTLAVDDMIEEFANVEKDYTAGKITRREIVQKQFDFMAFCAPGAFVDIETLDTNELLAACLDAVNAYNAPAIKARNESVLAMVRPILNSSEVQKALALSKVNNNVNV